MQAVDVLLRSDRVDRRVLVESIGQRELEQDRVNARVAVDLAEGRQQPLLRAPLGEQVVARRDADLVGRPLLAADVDLRRREIADQHHGERGGAAGLGGEAIDTGLDLGQHPRRDRLAVQDLHGAGAQAESGTRTRSMERPRPVSGSMRITAP